jgi:hypothetical protein
MHGEFGSSDVHPFESSYPDVTKRAPAYAECYNAPSRSARLGPQRSSRVSNDPYKFHNAAPFPMASSPCMAPCCRPMPGMQIAYGIALPVTQQCAPMPHPPALQPSLPAAPPAPPAPSFAPMNPVDDATSLQRRPRAMNFIPPPPPSSRLATELDETEPSMLTAVLLTAGNRWVSRLEEWLMDHPKHRPCARRPSSHDYPAAGIWLDKLCAWYLANFIGRKVRSRRHSPPS